MNDAVSEPGPPDGYEAVMAAVEAEARRIRESDHWTPDLQRELDALFEQLAPESEHDPSLRAAVDRAERAALIDLHAPVEDPRPGVAQAKRVVRKLVLWYLDYVVRQFSAFAGTSVRGLRLLADRVTELDEQVQAFAGAAADPAQMLDDAEFPAAWVEVAVSALEGSGRRVLHADAGDGTLVRRLREAGADAYGADTRHPDPDVDIRPEGAVEHLHTVGPAGLSGLVLSGFVDRIPARAKALVAELAAEVVEPGGVVVVLASRPHRTVGPRTVTLSDVAPGGPVQPPAWQMLLEVNGFEAVDLREGDTEQLEQLERLDASTPGAEVLNRNLARIEQALFAPPRYALIARRSRG